MAIRLTANFSIEKRIETWRQWNDIVKVLKILRTNAVNVQVIVWTYVFTFLE